MDLLRILFVLRLPARLTVLEVSVLLGFHVDAIRFLVKIGLLEAIGQTEDVELMFDAAYIDGLRRNPKWLPMGLASDLSVTFTSPRTANGRAC